jgi:uncharacterized RDD family membrane protein YckC
VSHAERTHRRAAAVAAAVAARRNPVRSAGREPEYEGLVTRTLAFAVDAAVITITALVVGGAIGLCLSVLSIPSGVKDVLLGIGAFLSLVWSSVYFVTFWSTTGQTPGNRLLGIRVCRADDHRALHPVGAFVRLCALVLAAIPLLAGFLPILFDERRRGLQDILAGTIVIGAREHDEPPPPTAPPA